MGCIRFLLATWVIVTHSEPLFGVIGPKNYIGLNGDMAVTCFFIISGFLIAMILQQKYHSLGVFYVTRSIRIYAPYYAALVLTLAVYFLGFHLGTDFGKSVRAAADSGNGIAVLFFLATNLTIFGTEFATYLASSTNHFADVVLVQSHVAAGESELHTWINLLMVPQAWTLSLELQFYLLAPFLCRLRPAALGLTTLLIYLGQHSLLRTLADGGIQPDEGGSLIFQLQYFLFGVLAYAMYRELPLDSLRNKYARAASYGAVCLAFLLVLGGYAVVILNFMTEDLFYALFAFTVPFLFAAFRHQRWDRAIGELSYPMYLFHFALVPVVRSHMPAQFAIGIVTLAVTVALSALFLVTINRPVEAWRKGFARRAAEAERPALHGDRDHAKASVRAE